MRTPLHGRQSGGPLRPHPCRDNLRNFFQACFPTLLTRLFGFDDQDASWFSLVASVGAGRLVSLGKGGGGEGCCVTPAAAAALTHAPANRATPHQTALFHAPQRSTPDDQRALLQLLAPDGALPRPHCAWRGRAAARQLHTSIVSTRVGQSGHARQLLLPSACRAAVQRHAQCGCRAPDPVSISHRAPARPHPGGWRQRQQRRSAMHASIHRCLPDRQAQQHSVMYSANLK